MYFVHAASSNLVIAMCVFAFCAFSSHPDTRSSDCLGTGVFRSQTRGKTRIQFSSKFKYDNNGVELYKLHMEVFFYFDKLALHLLETKSIFKVGNSVPCPILLQQFDAVVVTVAFVLDLTIG